MVNEMKFNKQDAETICSKLTVPSSIKEFIVDHNFKVEIMLEELISKKYIAPQEAGKLRKQLRIGGDQ